MPDQTARFDRWMKTATVLLIVGALSWVLKIAVIVLADGATIGVASTIAGVLWMTGFAGMFFGSSAAGLWLTRGRQRGMRLTAAFVAPFLFVASMNFLDPLAEAMFNDAGPGYMEEEWGILLAALLWLAVGARVAIDRRTRLVHQPA